MTRPLVSILTPSFNQGLWLRSNLRSVAHQDYPRIEQIVADGGSSDESVAILRDAGPGVRWISEPDNGQSGAINKAYRMAGGDIIGWLNSDDAFFAPDVVRLAVEAFDRWPSVDLVYGHAALTDSVGNVMQVLWVPPFSQRLLRTYNFVIQPAVFLRRSALAGDRLVDEAFEFMMDKELWLRLAGSSRMKRVDRILAIDRHHDGRKSYTRPDLAQADEGRLGEMYGIRIGRLARAHAKAVKVALRLAGSTKVLEASRPAPGFDLRSDRAARLLLRQAAVPRQFMRAVTP